MATVDDEITKIETELSEETSDSYQENISIAVKDASLQPDS